MSQLIISWSDREIGGAASELRSKKYTDFQIDLSAISFIDSLDLVRNKCLLDVSKSLGISSSVIPPQNANVKDYAGRMGLFEGTTYNYPLRERKPDKFTELLRIENDRNDQLFEECQRVFSYTNASVNYTPRLSEAFTELADNVYYHAGEKLNCGWGYAHAQVLEKGWGPWKKGYVRVAVADPGVGFYGSYLRTGQTRNRSEIQILQDAFNPGESSLNVPPGPGVRGIGLYEVLEFVKRFSGRIRLRTGSAQVIGTADGLKVSNLPFSVSGTWIDLEVPIL